MVRTVHGAALGRLHIASLSYLPSFRTRTDSFPRMQICVDTTGERVDHAGRKPSEERFFQYTSAGTNNRRKNNNCFYSRENTLPGIRTGFSLQGRSASFEYLCEHSWQGRKFVNDLSLWFYVKMTISLYDSTLRWTSYTVVARNFIIISLSKSRINNVISRKLFINTNKINSVL